MSENILSGEELIEYQKETIVMVKEYLTKLIPGMNNSIAELKGDMKEDTWEYLRMIIDGFNWVVEAYNGVSSIINKDNIIDENAVEMDVKNLGKSFKAKNPEETASVLENGILPFLKTLSDCCDKF